ncbi:hypothetical protein OROGR_003758 [Orobanche gracilis]
MGLMWLSLLLGELCPKVVPSQYQFFHATVSRPKSQSAPVPCPIPLSRLTDSFLDGTSSVYLEELQIAWEKDPNNVDESWDNFVGQVPPHLEFLDKQFKRVCGCCCL